MGKNLPKSLPASPAYRQAGFAEGRGKYPTFNKSWIERDYQVLS
jgi:hypothetical protein